MTTNEKHIQFERWMGLHLRGQSTLMTGQGIYTQKATQELWEAFCAGYDCATFEEKEIRSTVVYGPMEAT